MSPDWNYVIPYRELNAVFNTNAHYNCIDLIPTGVVLVSDTVIGRKESLPFLLIELV